MNGLIASVFRPLNQTLVCNYLANQTLNKLKGILETDLKLYDVFLIFSNFCGLIVVQFAVIPSGDGNIS